MKLKHWRGVWGIFASKGAPNGDLQKWTVPFEATAKEEAVSPRI